MTERERETDDRERERDGMKKEGEINGQILYLPNLRQRPPVQLRMWKSAP